MNHETWLGACCAFGWFLKCLAGFMFWDWRGFLLLEFLLVYMLVLRFS